MFINRYIIIMKQLTGQYIRANKAMSKMNNFEDMRRTEYNEDLEIISIDRYRSERRERERIG